jgi:hypothetical protein
MSESAAAPSTPTPSDAPKPAKVMPKGSSTSLLFTLAVVASSLVIAVPLLFSRLVEGILDSTNPANVPDTSAGLAYLTEILGWSLGSLGVLLVVIIVLYVLIYRRERTLDALKLPLLILALQIVLGVLILLFNAIVNNAG